MPDAVRIVFGVVYHMTYIPPQTQPITLPASSKSDQSVTEQLAQLNGAMRAAVHLLTQILAVSRGQQDPKPREEADDLIGEYTDPRNTFTNLIN